MGKMMLMMSGKEEGGGGGGAVGEGVVVMVVSVLGKVKMVSEQLVSEQRAGVVKSWKRLPCVFLW